jgi:activator of 2-hydroxyglutaryl-CoA dehydratase
LKAISSTFGKVKKAGMKNHCAAENGNNLKIIIKTLGFNIDEFDGDALLFEEDALIE